MEEYRKNHKQPPLPFQLMPYVDANVDAHEGKYIAVADVVAALLKADIYVSNNYQEFEGA